MSQSAARRFSWQASRFVATNRSNNSSKRNSISWVVFRSHKKALTTSTASGHQEFLTQTAGISPNRHLPALLRTLPLIGYDLVHATDRAGLHPLVIPLARPAAAAGGTAAREGVLGMLRLPGAADGDSLPLVRVQAGGLGLQLEANSVRLFLARAAATAEWGAEEGAAAPRPDPPTAAGLCLSDGGVWAGGVPPPAVAESAASAGAVFEAGEARRARAAGRLSLTQFLALKVGPFPDLYERLAADHAAAGNLVAALVAAERGASHADGWGRGHVFHSRLFMQLGRTKEARDAGRAALTMPLWTLGCDFESAARLAGGVDLGGLKERLLFMSNQAREAELQQGTRTAAEVACERADQLLNCVVLGVFPGWDGVRERLAGLYLEGGRADMARFVAQ